MTFVEFVVCETRRIAVILTTNIFAVYYVFAIHKGQLISKCSFGVIVWTKIQTKKFPEFLPYPLKRGQIKKVV